MEHGYIEGRLPFGVSLQEQPGTYAGRMDLLKSAEPSALQAALAQQVSELRDRVRELEGQVAELIAAPLRAGNSNIGMMLDRNQNHC